MASLFQTSLYAQKKEEQHTVKPKDNIVKLNISSLLFKTACVQYEHRLSDKYSATLTAFYRPKAGFAILDNASSAGVGDFNNLKLQTMSITPAIRKYRKAHAPSGSYFEYSARYRRDQSSLSWDKQSDYGNINLNLKEDMFLLGFMYGYQFYTKKNFTIDLWIIGLGIGLHKHYATSTFVPKKAGDPIDESIRLQYETDYPKLIPNGDNQNWEGSQMKTSATRIMLPPRGFGFTLGFAF